MDKINFEDLPSTDTPVNADNLNDLQDNVDNAKLDKTITVTQANQDLNNYIEEGRYYFANAPTNSPSGVGWVEVYTNSSENTIKQIYIDGSNVVFMRQYVNGTWSAWKRLATEHDCYYMSGDTFRYYIKTAAVTRSSNFWFQIPLNKPIKSGVTPRVTISDGALYQSSVINIVNYITSISASIAGATLEVNCDLSGTPSNYSVNVPTITDLYTTVTFS